MNIENAGEQSAVLIENEGALTKNATELAGVNEQLAIEGLFNESERGLEAAATGKNIAAE